MSLARPYVSKALHIDGGAALSMLNLAVHYELAGPDGSELTAPDFPVIEELFLLGQQADDTLSHLEADRLETVQAILDRVTAVLEPRCSRPSR